MNRSLAGFALCALLFAFACGEQEKVPTAPLPPAVPIPAPAPPQAAPAQVPVPVAGAAPAPAPAPAPAASAAVPDPAPAAAPAPAPATAAAAPASGGSADAARGGPLYATNCSSCHGPKGEGDGPVGLALVPKPAKHSDGAYMNPIPNEQLFKTIKEGGAAVGKSPMMAPWGGVLTDAQIWDVVAFVRSLATPPYPGTVP